MFELDLTNKPVERLKQVHRDLNEKRMLAAKKREELFEDCKEVIAERERWSEENKRLEAAQVNSVHIRGRLNVHEANIEALWKDFDDGKLTPTTIYKAPPTDLEIAKENLDKAGAKITELKAELEKLKDD